MDSIAYYPFPTEMDSSNEQRITLPQELYDNFDTNFRLQLQNKYNIFVYDVDSKKIKQFKAVITPQGITLSKKIYGWLNETHVINQSLEVAWNNQLNNGLNLRIRTKTQRKDDGKLPTWRDIIDYKYGTTLLMIQVNGDDDIKQLKGCLISIVEMIWNNPPDSLTVRQLYDMITKAEELSEKDVDVKCLQSSLKSIKALKKLSKTQIALSEADDRRSQVNAEIEEAEKRWNVDKAAARLKKLRKERAVHEEYNAELDKKKELVSKLKKYGANSSSCHRSYLVL